MADKYFGDEDPLGKTIQYEDITQFTVSGVIENIPENTHFKFDAVFSLSSLNDFTDMKTMLADWGSNNFLTYIKLKSKIPVSEFTSKLDDFIDRHLTDLYSSYGKKDIQSKPHESTRLYAQPLASVHLQSRLSTEIEPGGSMKSVRIFSIVSVFILFTACINFMNLTTARAVDRAKETGVRKVSGAGRKNLIVQFMSESFIMTFMALVLAISMVDLVLPFFNNYFGKSIQIHGENFYSLSLLIIVLLVVVTFVSGSYPALVLSSFEPVKTLKQHSQTKHGRSTSRTVLVIFQFAVSVALIIGIIVIQKQVSYFKNKDLGFTRDQMLILHANDQMIKNISTVKQQLMSYPGVEKVTSSRLIPSNNLINSSGGKTLDGENPGEISFRLADVSVDYDFFNTYDIQILTGRNFDEKYASDDSTSFILNAKAVRKLGWGEPEQAIGRPFSYNGITGEIIGVTKDINFENLRNPVVPIIYSVRPEKNNRISIKLSGRNIPETIRSIENLYKKYNPSGFFHYRFLDEIYNQLYHTESQLGEVVGFFSVLAIIIACLGLFGLASYMTVIRTKEIGIRKALGASIPSIIYLISKDFIKWIMMANIIAWPVAWLIMKNWLDNFAYHIDIHLWIFIMSGMISVVIAFITTGIHSVISALKNPVEAIRYE